MTTAKKIAWVLGGYLLAFIAAFCAVRIYIALTGHVDRQLYSGMSAFGDTFFFLAAFGMAAVPATGAMMYFLRAYRPVWAGFAVAAAALTVTGWLPLGMILPLRVLAAPFLAGGFLLCGLFSPIPWARVALLLSTVNETLLFLIMVFGWTRPR